MTTGASIRRNALMIKLGTGKGNCRMTGFARKLGCEVGTGLDHIGARKPCATHMTTRTFLGRSLEDPGDMARFATRIRMHSAQGKTRFEVIKVAGPTLGKKHAAKQQHGQRKNRPKRPIHAGTLCRASRS